MPILDFITYVLFLINAVVVPLILAVAFLAFVWGVAQAFVLNADNDEKRKEGKKFVLYGLIGFFLMLSVWGLTQMLVDTFGFDRATRPDVPHF